MRIITAVFTTILVTSASAEAADWKRVGDTDTGTVWYIDQESVSVQGDLAKGWFRADEAHDKTTKNREEKHLIAFSCREKTSATLSFTTYGPNGAVKHTVTDYSAQFAPIPPGSIGDIMVHAICGMD